MGGGGVGQILFGWMMQTHAGIAVQQYSVNDFNFAMLIFPLAIIVALISIFYAKEKLCK